MQMQIWKQVVKKQREYRINMSTVRIKDNIGMLCSVQKLLIVSWLLKSIIEIAFVIRI
jgi:hypothetical protein